MFNAVSVHNEKMKDFVKKFKAIYAESIKMLSYMNYHKFLSVI